MFPSFVGIFSYKQHVSNIKLVTNEIHPEILLIYIMIDKISFINNLESKLFDHFLEAVGLGRLFVSMHSICYPLTFK